MQTQIFVLSRKKIILVSVTILIVLLASSLILKETQMVLSNSKQLTVIIDPGHGGVDSGAVYGKIMEKDITLNTSLYIKELLEERKIPFHLTRQEDIDLGGELTKGRHKRDLLARREIINQGKIAVSIHVNTIDDSEEEGAVVFYAKGSTEGERLAACILSELGKVQKLNYPEPIPRTNLFLLRTSKPPMVLVELGFISNSEDRAKLVRTDFQKKCAQAIVTGIEKYLGNEL